MRSIKSKLAGIVMCLAAAGTSAQPDVPLALTDAQSKFLGAVLADRGFQSVVISPDGRRVAAIVLKRYVNQQIRVEASGEYTTGLFLIDIDSAVSTLIVPTKAIGGGTMLRAPTSSVLDRQRPAGGELQQRRSGLDQSRQ